MAHRLVHFETTLPDGFFLCILGLWGFLSFRGAPLTAYGSSKAKGRIGAVAASLHRNHSNVGSKPYMGPTPQLTATPDP